MGVGGGVAFRVTLGAAVGGCLVFVFASCGSLKPIGGAALGAGAGLLLGPGGALAGAALGAGGGAVWEENSRLKGELDGCKASLAAVQTDVIELRATARANEQISAFNAGQPVGRRAVPPLHEPVETGDAATWFSRAWKGLLGALALGAGWHYRKPLKRAWHAFPDKVRGRARTFRSRLPHTTDLNPEP